MLILRRSCRQRVLILLEDGREIDVIVEDIDNRKVALGFRAPDGVLVMREEVLDRVQRGRVMQDD